VAHAQALDAGLNAITRDIFLDNETNPESIRLQYNIWLTKARERGSAIAIGHPYPNTIAVLRESLGTTNTDFRFLRISSLISERKSLGLSAENPPSTTAAARQY
jgi:hypothetical protein